MIASKSPYEAFIQSQFKIILSSRQIKHEKHNIPVNIKSIQVTNKNN